MIQGKRLLVVQEILPSYRIPVFNSLSIEWSGSLTLLAENNGADFGEVADQNIEFKLVQALWVKLFGFFKYDWKIIDLWRNNDVILHVADFKFFSLWLLLFASCFSNKKMYLHGQGGYKRKGLASNIVYSTVTFLCDGYICYTDYSKKELVKKLPKFLHEKITICHNMLDVNPVDYVPFTKPERSIFYIGRLRDGCAVEVLLDAAKIASVRVEVIGAGDPLYLDVLKNKYGTIATFHCAVFDEQEQKRIARNCIAGAYGGDAGLSVVHYMALGLPVIVHNDIKKHMGPEPSYVIDGINGLTFSRNSARSLAEKITLLTENEALRYKLAVGALNTFKELQSPSMGEKFSLIMGGGN
jgi:glycosyltransferase involved in cell wall biosynthesis